jgi:hypothetical protein
MFSSKLLLFLCSLFLFLDGFGKYRISAPAAWVVFPEFDFSATIPAKEISDGYYTLFNDEQVNAETHDYYYHYAYKIVSEAGVQNGSQLSFSYDPTFQSFTIHKLEVIREGKKIDKIKTSKIDELQREADFEAHIYDATLTITVIFEDVQAGDIIHYSYSVKGQNPVFNNKFHYVYYPQSRYTIPGEFMRIVIGTSRTVNSKSFFSAPSFTEKNLSGNLKELVLTGKNISPFRPEEFLPSWYNPWPRIEMSEYQSWEEVESWAWPRYKTGKQLSGALKEKILEIQQFYKDDEDKRAADEGTLLAMVRYVQDKIRYMGFEIGANGYFPHEPSKVFSQKFGDCKDKAYLLATALTGMGYPSHVAIVSSYEGKSINEMLPSPFAFNHAIVKTTWNGKDYWFDATVSYQRGNLMSMYWANFGYALVLDGQLTGLEKMPQCENSLLYVNEEITIKNMEGKAAMHVRTIYYGKEADDFRYQLAQSSMNDMSKNYLDFYKVYFPDIVSAGDIVATDSAKQNEIIVDENYTFNSIWEQKDGDVKKLFVEAHAIKDRLKNFTRANMNRKSPIKMDFPMEIRQKISIVLPETWTVKDDEDVVKKDYISFSANLGYTHKKINLNYHVKSMDDQIPVEKLSEAVQDFTFIADNIGYEITSRADTKQNEDVSESKFSGKLAGLAILGFLVLTGGIIGIIKKFG